jgi:hypothetical protein
MSGQKYVNCDTLKKPFKFPNNRNKFENTVDFIHNDAYLMFLFTFSLTVSVP